MRYLKFRNISILLEVQEIDKLPLKNIYIGASPSETLRKWSLADTSHGGWEKDPHVKDWYLNMHQLEKKKNKKTQENKNEKKKKPSPTPYQ